MRFFVSIEEIKWIFIVPLIGSQSYKGDTLSTSSTWKCKKNLISGFHKPEYDDLGLFDKHAHKNATTSLAFCNFTTLGLSCYLPRNLLMTTLAPSWGPFPWPLLKKINTSCNPWSCLDTLTQNTLVCYS
jgi:hypothetical protein